MSIRSTTARTVAQAVRWVEENQHHYVSADEPKRPGYLLLRGRQAQLWVPPKLLREFQLGTRTTLPSEFDERLYRANDLGRAIAGIKTAERALREFMVAAYGGHTVGRCSLAGDPLPKGVRISRRTTLVPQELIDVVRRHI